MHESGKKTSKRVARSASLAPNVSRTTSHTATVPVSPNTNAARNAASGRLRRVTSATPLIAAGKAGKKAQRLPRPSWYIRSG